MTHSCPYCKKIKDAKFQKLYEDELVTAFLEDNRASEGHAVVVSKEHYPIMELVPDNVLSKMFEISNRISTSLFEVLSPQGTNLLINNGISAGQEFAHFAINIIPRKDDDGLSFEWSPKQLSQEEMATIELKYNEEINKEETKEEKTKKEEFVKTISQKIDGEITDTTKSTETTETEKKTEQKPQTEEEEINYLIKQLDRIP